MNDVLLEAISTLYHSGDGEAKKRASRWLEDWRLQSEAWTVSVSLLHSAMTNVEVLLFAAQTLVAKIQQDFEELPIEDLQKLRESLISLLLKFSQDPSQQVIQLQVALAISAFCAHAHGSLWRPHTCIQWLAQRFSQEPTSVSFTCLIELLVVIPEEASNHRIGLHPSRRAQYEQELQDDFLTVLEVLEKSRGFVTTNQILRVLSNWFGFCRSQILQSSLNRLGPFVQLAVEALLQTTDENFKPAVNTISELLHVTRVDHETIRPELRELLEYLASSILKLLPQFQQNLNEAGDLEFVSGIGRLFCDLGIEHEELILAKTQTSSTLVDAILAVTSHPDHDVHSFALDFWEKLSIAVNTSSENGSEYFLNIFKRLLPVLLNLAKLPEDYPQMSKEERRELDRWAVWDAFMDAVTVLGPDEYLSTFINSLTEYNNKPNPAQHWREIESLIFSIRAVNSRSKGSRDKLVVPLFNALGTVPENPVLQSAMCCCLADYSRWLPSFVRQCGADPLQLLFPVICRNLSHEESMDAAVDAFCGICESCTSYLEGYLSQLIDLYHQLIFTANSAHGWVSATSPGVCLSVKESKVLDVIGAMIDGVSRLESEQRMVSFLSKISESMTNEIRQIAQEAFTNPQTENKMTILLTRLKFLFKDCNRGQITAQILHSLLLELLQIADKASSSHSIVEEVCGCLRYAIKGAKESCGEDVQALSVSLPKLFSKSHHCGYLYVSSELAKVFGQHPDRQQDVHKLIIDQLMLVCAKLKEPSDFHNDPDLVDDAFLMATRVVNYCPEVIFNDGLILMQILDTASKGILVHHEDACRSVLSFLASSLNRSNPSNPDFIKNALSLQNRGFYLTKLLLAGVGGALTIRVLDDLSDALYWMTIWSEEWKLGWLNASLLLIPEQVLTNNEKKTSYEDFKSAINKDSKRSFSRVVKDLSVICRRNRVARIQTQKALLPDEMKHLAK